MMVSGKLLCTMNDLISSFFPMQLGMDIILKHHGLFETNRKGGFSI